MKIRRFFWGGFLFVCLLGQLFGLGAGGIQLVPGTVTFTFTPIGLSEYTGTWEAVIISPDGEFDEIGPVACDSSTPIEYVFSCCNSEYTELGCYAIILKNNIVASSDVNFIDKIVVSTSYGQDDEIFPSITYRHIVPSSEGENILLYYVLPSMLED